MLPATGGSGLGLQRDQHPSASGCDLGPPARPALPGHVHGGRCTHVLPWWEEGGSFLSSPCGLFAPIVPAARLGPLPHRQRPGRRRAGIPALDQTELRSICGPHATLQDLCQAGLGLFIDA